MMLGHDIVATAVDEYFMEFDPTGVPVNSGKWDTARCKQTIMDTLTDEIVGQIFTGYYEPGLFADEAELKLVIRTLSHWKREFKVRQDDGTIRRVFDCRPLGGEFQATFVTDAQDQKVLAYFFSPGD